MIQRHNDIVFGFFGMLNQKHLPPRLDLEILLVPVNC